jgi:hypothetical protein
MMNFFKKNSKESFEKLSGKVKMNRKQLSQITGGYGRGLFATVSGDCNTSGRSCWVIFGLPH